MFFRTDQKALKQLEKEDAELAEILRAVNELLRMTRGKLAYVTRCLEEHRFRKFFFSAEHTKYLAQNKELLAKIDTLIKEETRLRKDERFFRKVFRKQIKDTDEAIKILKRLKQILGKEEGILKNRKTYKSWETIHALAKLISNEVELLQIETPLASRLKDNIGRLQVRMKINKALPVMKTKYYHGSQFRFMAGERLKCAGPRRDMMGRATAAEKLIEEVRKKEFPDKPSRYNCVYVDKNPRVAADYGKVYALEVKANKIHDTDGDIYTRVRDKLRDGHHDNAYDEARSYWKRRRARPSQTSETLIEGEVRIIGLADIFYQGDKVIIISDNVTDYDGNKIPKGTKAEIDGIQKHGNEEIIELYISDDQDVEVTPDDIQLLAA